MRYQVALLLPVLLCATVASAQQTVSVTFADASPRTVWVGTSAPEAPKNPLKVDQAAISVAVSSSTGVLYALDSKTGNLASLPVVKAKGNWVVKASDFSHIGSVLVRVSFGGKPVAAAQVALKDSARTQSSFLDPSSAGQLAFYDVVPGSLKVTVRYKSDGSDATPVNQDFDQDLRRTSPTPILEVALPQKAATVGGDQPTAAGGAESRPVTPPEMSVNPLGKFMGMLMGLALAGVVVYLAMQYMKKNPEKVTAKLEQYGVQVPKPQDDEPLDPGPPIPAPKPEPPQKIVLDDATPTPLASTPIASVPPIAALTGVPRLVAENGDELPLDDGELTIGRDVGIGLSLPSETTVSRRHAVVVKAGSQVVVRDLGSTNGTYVNGSRIQSEVALRPGDAVQFGAVTFRFEG